MSAFGPAQPPAPASPPHLDPPFRGYIETTYDSLLVFEAARRGMIPRVTRRLIERERGMVQSGAVFVFDEQESGIRRWTDGLIWSPSRILGNFLVYRETDKRSTTAGLTDSPGQGSPSGTPSRYTVLPNPGYAESSQMAESSSGGGDIPILAQGAIQPRPEGEAGMDKQRERQLVGSLTNSYKFKEGGLVKKTMSVNIGNYSQHMISYYTIQDVMSGKLRTPSTIPELAALEISVDYLQKQNFRFPPMVEIGIDGVPRYRGEAEEPMSPNTPMTGLSIGAFPNSADMSYDPYGGQPSQSQLQLQMEPPRHPHSRSVTHPQHMPIPLPAHGHSLSPSSYVPHQGGHYFDPNFSSSAPSGSGAQPIPIQRQVSAGGGPMRPSSSRARYDPYASPRVVSLGPGPSPHPGSQSQMHEEHPVNMYRRQSVPHHPSHLQQQQQEYYQQYDIKPIINASGNAQYAYQPPATAPGSFAEYSHTPISSHPGGSGFDSSTPTPISAPVQIASPIISYTPTPSSHSQSYTPHSGWHSAPPTQPPPPGSQSRLLPAQPREYARSPLPTHIQLTSAGVDPAPPSSSGSDGSGRPISSRGDFAYAVPPFQSQQPPPSHHQIQPPWDQPNMEASNSQTLGMGISQSGPVNTHGGVGTVVGQYVSDEWSSSSAS